MKRKKRIGTVGKAIGCILLLFVALFPIYWLVAMAIRPTSEMTGHISIIPHALTGSHFVQLFKERGFSTAIVNSLQTTIGSLILSLIVGICAAYVLARRRFRFGLKKPMTYWILLVRVLPPVAFTIPLYTMFSKVGILNTKLPVLLACVLINVPLIIWFLISFFQDLPEEIEMEDTDFTILFGNLLENAWEAARKRKEDGYIKVQIQDQGNQIIACIENSYDQQLLSEKKGFRSTKHEGMGIGTRSARLVVEKWNGVMEWQGDGGIFRVRLVLPQKCLNVVEKPRS